MNIKNLLLKRNFTKDILYLSLMLTLPALLFVYGMINNSNTKVYNLVTDIDRNTPFIKEFIIPYLFWYGFIYVVLIYIYFNDKSIYLKTLLACGICIVLSFLVYILFQTTVPRPVLSGNDFFTNLVKQVYKFDKPFNCFPSIHCMSSYLMISGVRRIDSKNKFFKILVYITSILIIISTLFVKQHVILDVIAGIMLGKLTFKVILLTEEISFSKIKKQVQ